MTKFVKEQFTNASGYVTYNGEFILRDKYNTSVGTKINFLIKNFEVEEYLARLNGGEHPLPILESKGYLLPHIKKWLKEGGFPVTPDGYKQFKEAKAQNR